ncbi:Tartrate-resistant acid phosphatase type 5 [Quaeritorhiza haematococci]|nr:Tartrate-resistant acid phosphatase type 5 [Quaeritorhiza haematococci]
MANNDVNIRTVSSADIDGNSNLNANADSEVNLNFLILGDWGGPDEKARFQVAEAMEQVAEKTNPKFVLSTGDNFYSDGSNYNWYGVRDINDPKFRKLWKQSYRGRITQIPWLIVQGNHDWRGNPTAQVEFSKKDSLWVHPDFFWEKVVTLEFPSASSADGWIEAATDQHRQKAAFIFIDTQLIAYGYEPSEKEEPGIANNFRKLGWVPNAQSIKEHIRWIESALKRHNDKHYIFVVGHHPLGVCKGAGRMPQLMKLFQRYSVTAYFFGHVHAMHHARAGNTFYVESGSGSRRGKPCAKGPLQGTAGEWSVAEVNGFARGVLDRHGFAVEYYDQDAKLLHRSERIGPRDRMGSAGNVVKHNDAQPQLQDFDDIQEEQEGSKVENESNVADQPNAEEQDDERGHQGAQSEEEKFG